MDPLVVIATIRARPGKEKEAEALLKSLLEPTHREPGCVLYALHKRMDAPGTFFFVEKWKSQADLDAHLKSSHIQAALARQAEILELLDIATAQTLSSGPKGLL